MSESCRTPTSGRLSLEEIPFGAPFPIMPLNPPVQFWGKLSMDGMVTLAICGQCGARREGLITYEVEPEASSDSDFGPMVALIGLVTGSKITVEAAIRETVEWAASHIACSATSARQRIAEEVEVYQRHLVEQARAVLRAGSRVEPSLHSLFEDGSHESTSLSVLPDPYVDSRQRQSAVEVLHGILRNSYRMKGHQPIAVIGLAEVGGASEGRDVWTPIITRSSGRQFSYPIKRERGVADTGPARLGVEARAPITHRTPLFDGLMAECPHV